MSNEDRDIRRDRMRYSKNTLSSNLTLLAILFDVFFFINIYKSDVGSYYYTILIGASIIYNLVFMLAAFLSSEGVKNYKVSYCYVLAVIGVLQFVRIGILPARAHGAVYAVGESSTQVMSDGQFTRVVLYLLISGACCLAAAAIGIYKSRELDAHIASLNGKTV